MMIDGQQSFWIVTKPTAYSELADILFDATFGRLALQFAGGLDPVDILGIYDNYEQAQRDAMVALRVRDKQAGTREP
jgi:hypothetical protein